ncbi:uncharacterized protein RAG0_11366 [Rhynchosporium agropyri]|uniref:Uncharacterized protein n=1 Tax=Rhynchosporium agropyri TaxID=914238 RepID=A0A1E1L3Q9_9HELO|nr:uncharacterized protein RAG0_11366 [Rhynchosporium agropyri]
MAEKLQALSRCAEWKMFNSLLSVIIDRNPRTNFVADLNQTITSILDLLQLEVLFKSIHSNSNPNSNSASFPPLMYWLTVYRSFDSPPKARLILRLCNDTRELLYLDVPPAQKSTAAVERAMRKKYRKERPPFSRSTAPVATPWRAVGIGCRSPNSPRYYHTQGHHPTDSASCSPAPPPAFNSGSPASKSTLTGVTSQKARVVTFLSIENKTFVRS